MSRGNNNVQGNDNMGGGMTRGQIIIRRENNNSQVNNNMGAGWRENK